MRLIDADKLYENTANLEAIALEQVNKYDPRIEEEYTDWVRWSAILTERTAFKHDIADALTILEK